MRHMTITFRGFETEIVIDQYDDDPETNSCMVEWHFDGLTQEERDDLHVSDEEDEEIVQQIHKAMADYR